MWLPILMEAICGELMRQNIRSTSENWSFCLPWESKWRLRIGIWAEWDLWEEGVPQDGLWLLQEIFGVWFRPSPFWDSGQRRKFVNFWIATLTDTSEWQTRKRRNAWLNISFRFCWDQPALKQLFLCSLIAGCTPYLPLLPLKNYSTPIYHSPFLSCLDPQIGWTQEVQEKL